VIKMSFQLCLKEFVAEPYHHLIDDYLEKKNQEAEMLNERFELINQKLNLN